MKSRRSFYLSDDDLGYILDYQKKHKNSSRNDALSSILNEHKSNSQVPMQSMYEFLAKQIAQELKNQLQNEIADKVISTLKPQLKSLKGASSATNKDTQILLELINGIYFKEQYGMIPPIDGVPTEAYKLSKEQIETKIAKQHYKNSGTLD